MATTIANLLIKMEADTTNVSAGLNNVTKGVLAVGAAIAGVSAVSLQLFDKQDKAEKSLLTALKGRVDIQQRLIKQAGEFQKVSLFGDEQIIQQQSFLASLKLTEDQINEVLGAAIDLSAGTGTTLESAVKNLAKTFGGLTGELGESIPELKTLTVEQLKAGKAIDLVAKAFEGQGKAAAEAGLGPVKQLQNALGDLAEIAGKVLQPAVAEAAKLIRAFVEEIQNAAGGEGIIKLQAELLTIVKSFGIWTEAMRDSLGTLVGLFRGGEAVVKLFKGDFSGALDSAKKALTEFVRPFQGIAQLGDRVNQVIETYGKTLTELRNKVEPVVKEQAKLSPSFEGVGRSVAVLSNQVDDLNFKLDKMGNFFSRIGDQNVSLPTIPTIDSTVQASAPNIDISSQFNTDVIEAYRAQLQGLLSDYTNLQGPIQAYIASLTNVNDIQAAINASTEGFAKIALSIGDAVTAYAQQGGSSLREFARVALKASREVIGGFIREGVAAAVSNALKTIPFPLNIAAGAIAGALAQTLFNRLLQSVKIPAFGDGGLVTKPTLALVGEKGPELITPLRDLNTGGGLDIRVTGEIEGNKLKLLMDQQDRIGRRKFA